MPITFYGKWSLTVVGNVGEFQQRVRISGSLASDGVVPGTVGTQVAAIDGAAWNIFMDRSSDGGATWQENLVQRVASIRPPDGLIFTLYADDSIVPPQASDFSVDLKYLDQQVNPPGQPPYGFTLPPGSFWPPRPCLKEPECSCCHHDPCVCCGHVRLIKQRRCKC